LGATVAVLGKTTISEQVEDRDRVTQVALEREVERCYPLVLRGLVAVAGSREPAEDAMHEAIVAALQQGVADVRRLDAWLYVVGLRALRRARWRQRLSSPLKFLTASSPAPGLERVHVLELLRQLTPRQREFVVARYYLGLSYDEIANQFDVSLGTATSTVTQSLAKLRRSLVEVSDEQ
jgi:DNA-directed RNA polymerase specialized sigma24 family protein